MDATGLLVTPGFVDIHTHYDGQATWDPILAPSAWHGVTSIVMGNCGVGFAPARPDEQVEQPFVVVGSAISPVQARDLELFAKQRLARTAEIKELEIVEGHARTIAGRNAYVIEARAKDHSSGRPLGLYQMMLFADDTYFLVQAMVGEALWDDYLPEFEQIAASLELR